MRMVLREMWTSAVSDMEMWPLVLMIHLHGPWCAGVTQVADSRVSQVTRVIRFSSSQAHEYLYWEYAGVLLHQRQIKWHHCGPGKMKTWLQAGRGQSGKVISSTPPTRTCSCC